jgi:7-cyano-7-deazaguanine synthase in queuosine biosynthesis
MKNLTKINICDVNIDLLPGPIGISHSGGADSGILLYILMKYHQGPIHVYTCASKEKQRIAPHIALNVMSKCMDLTNNSNVMHHVFYVEKQTISTLFDPLKLAINFGTVNYVYTGGTSLPPDDVLKTFKTNNDLYQRRNPNIEKPVYYEKIYAPFMNINKKKIKQIYQELEVLDVLFPITRSCEDLNLTSGHCGKCWWCEERQWAFEEL